MILTFDIGGTNLRAGLYDIATDRLVARDQCPAPSYLRYPGLNTKVLQEKLYAGMRALSHKIGLPRPKIIGVAFPGPIEQGIALQAPTLWGHGIVPQPVTLKLKKLWPEAHVGVFNDLTAAGFSFLQKPDEDMCIVTVSSGIGMKVFIDGKPALGPRCRGGEIGHWRVVWEKDAPICDCGGIGHLGAVASGRATPLQVKRLISEDPSAYAASVHGGKDPKQLTNEEICRAFRDSDVWTRKLIKMMAQPLGRVLAAIHLSVGTERFLVMGGFANALGQAYIDLVKSEAEAVAWEPSGERRWAFELGMIGDDAGLLGSGRLVSRQFEVRQTNNGAKSRGDYAG